MWVFRFFGGLGSRFGALGLRLFEGCLRCSGSVSALRPRIREIE